MKTNILKAILNIKDLNIFNFDKIYPKDSELRTKNRIQTVGDALETFIKDAFSNSFYNVEKDEIYSKYFSYLGNANNPPDSIIKNGDAIEVKKLESFGEIQLNSSFPKAYLSCHDELITSACKNCEDKEWNKKDIIYTIGNFKGKDLKLLFLIYGDCFAASPEIYANIKTKLSDTISSLPNSELTNELGRINKVDPLGVTKLRIRGMWLLKHPLKIFSNKINYDIHSQKSTVIGLMKKDKFDSFPQEDKERILNDEDIHVEEIKISYPDNPAKLIEAILVRYDKK